MLECSNSFEPPQETQTFDTVLCFYINATNKIQVIHINNCSRYSLEKVVFPKQRLLFEALPKSELEVHTGFNTGAIVVDRNRCDRLQVFERETY